jgi:asparagine synthase (glutamine-hydrolysing)
MCGIFSYINSNKTIKQLKNNIDLIQYRGPDSSSYTQIDDNVIFGFHRLSINGLGQSGEQPLYHPQDKNISLICNGEIYNYKELSKQNNYKLYSTSDCEIILHLYKEHGIQKTCQMLDGVFMFVLHDKNKNEVFVARDAFGVRPGFIGKNNDEILVSSEMKSIDTLSNLIVPFLPGHVWSSKNPASFIKWYDNVYTQNLTKTEGEILEQIKDNLTSAVKKRMMSDREVGALLSGGLDSSLIAALAAGFAKENNKKIKTFSIGMKGSPDLEFAQKVADHIDSDHYNIEVTEQEFLNAIEVVIYNIESYDTTTVRASVGNYLVSKYISENTDVKVVFNGDGSDEVTCGYIYNANAPSPEELQMESEKLVAELFYYDVLRSDRSISSNGLEARTPFLDKAFVRDYIEINPELKMFGKNGKPEKYLLRKAFDDSDLLPTEVLWRTKEAFSDGVSSQARSWHTIIQEFINEKITDEEFENAKNKYPHCPPLLKESFYYREIFEKYYAGREKLIPHFWMPNWTDVIDPSARELSNYESNETSKSKVL